MLDGTCMIIRHPSSRLSKQNPVRASAGNYSAQASEASKEGTRKDISKDEDPFDAPTYNIPEKPVTFAEGASYTVVIFAGLGVAALAVYAILKELIFETREYKIFGKALQRVQNDSQVFFCIRGPHGAGKVYSEMFKDPADKDWKFTYLIVDITSPSSARLMLESYVPA